MNRRYKRVRIYWERIIPTAILTIIIIILLTFIFGKIFHHSAKSNSKPTNSSSAVSGENTINANYDFIKTDSNQIHSGNLILINSKFAFTTSMPTDVASVFKNKTKNYSVKDTTVMLKPEVITALNTMNDAFFAEKKNSGLMVISGFRTEDYQKKLYDDELAKTKATTTTLVALPGHSEHHSGYAIDFGIYKGTKSYDGTGDFAWINENCYKYGFIVRYKTDKASITGISNEPWHFRYVGQPHAFLINQNKFCYEEYIDYLKQFTFGKKHLDVTSFDGAKYEIYYVPAESEKTSIPVPKNKTYSISGNNDDGFIVTVTL